MRTKNILIFLCLVCTLIYSGFVLPIAEAKTNYIRIGSTAPGAMWYVVAARFADLLNQKIPGVKASVVPGGALANPRNVASGKIEIGMSFTTNSYLCYKGLPPYKEAHPNLRYIGSASESTLLCAVPRASEIYSYRDLYNKRINPLPVGYSTRVLVEVILGLHGITFDSIKKNGGVVHALGHSGGMAMMQDGKLDAHWCMGGLQPTLIALSEKPGIRLLSIDDEIREKIVKHPKCPGYFKSTYPGGVYKGVDKEVHSVGTVDSFVVDKDMPEDLVYQITKIFYESETLKDVYKGGEKRGLDPAFMVEKAPLGAVIPVHPGAKKYFQEKGINIK